MRDRVVLGLRASNLQERVVHELADVTGAYTAVGLSVDTLVGSTPDGLSAGVASALFDTANGSTSWDVLLVSCIEPLFWVVAEPSPEAAVAVNRTIGYLLALAGCSGGQDGAATIGVGSHVLGPAGVVDVASRRISPLLDVGKQAGFPAIGLAGRRDGYEPDVAMRLARAHVAALRHVRSDPGVVREVLHGRLGIAPADLPRVAGLVRRRFRVVPRQEARRRAVDGIDRLGLDVTSVERAFACPPSDCLEPVWS